MPRVTKAELENENMRLRSELAVLRKAADRARSRSPRRAPTFEMAPMSAASRRALDVVCKHDRDGVIEEQRATIAKQAQEIADLKVGKGPIGPILQAMSCSSTHDAYWADIAQTRTEPVAKFLKAVWAQSYNLQSVLLTGNRTF